MKKRLRKKLHLKEFKEFGLSFTCEHPFENVAKALVVDGNIDSLIDDFLEFIESKGLYCGGGWCPKDGNTLNWHLTIELRGLRGPTPPMEVLLYLQQELFNWFDARFPKFTMETKAVNLWTWDNDDDIALGKFSK